MSARRRPGGLLSYAGVDRAVATRVVQGLRAAGAARIWWDQDGIGWGDNWIDKLHEALSACSAYVILVGAGGVRRLVKAELDLATRRHFENDLPVFPLLLHGVTPDDLPPFLSVLQAQRLPEDLERFDFTELAARLAAIPEVEQEARSEVEGTCPFPGLEAFREDEARFFFGRQSETVEALRQLGPGLDGIYRRWLQIEGPSGVGKSSLVRAGLVPAIRCGWIEEGDRRRRWRVAPPMRPGADPIENLADSLSKAFGPEQGLPALGALDRSQQSRNVPGFRRCGWAIVHRGFVDPIACDRSSSGDGENMLSRNGSMSGGRRQFKTSMPSMGKNLSLMKRPHGGRPWNTDPSPH